MHMIGHNDKRIQVNICADLCGSKPFISCNYSKIVQNNFFIFNATKYILFALGAYGHKIDTAGAIIIAHETN